MKITPEHLAQLKALIQPNDTEAHRVTCRAQKMSDVGYRWQLVHQSKGALTFVCDHLYKYMNDEHIDTALRSFIKGY